MNSPVAGLIATLAAAALAPIAIAQEVINPVRPTPGATYFNRAGSSIGDEEADLTDCASVVWAASNDAPHYVGGILGDALTVGQAQVRLTANIENCMLMRHWRVVRLEQEEGARLKRLDTADLRAELEAWVGQETPHGQVVRVFTNAGARSDTLGDTITSPLSDSIQLSLRAAGDHRLKAAPATPVIKTKMVPGRNVKPLTLAELHSPDPATATIIVRLTGGTGDNTQTIMLVRRPASDLTTAWDEDGRPDVMLLLARSKPVRWAISADQAPAIAIAVPPGRWMMASYAIMDTCLSTPSFEARAGDVLYLGAFDFTKPVTMDLALDPGRNLLAETPALAARLRPADWENGMTRPCRGLFINGFEVPGAPLLRDTR